MLRSLEDKFLERERLLQGQLQYTPVPYKTKVSTIEQFYTAFYNKSTLLISTYIVCYRKFRKSKLEEINWRWIVFVRQYYPQFNYRRCFPVGEKVLRCGGCIKDLGKGVLSPIAYLYSRLRYKYIFLDKLKGLILVKEKLIALNSYYRFITKYAILGG